MRKKRPLSGDRGRDRSKMEEKKKENVGDIGCSMRARRCKRRCKRMKEKRDRDGISRALGEEKEEAIKRQKASGGQRYPCPASLMW